MKEITRIKEALKARKTIEGVIFIVVFALVFTYISNRMGLSNMLNTIMNTAHELLLNTVFYLMGVVVLSGAVSKLLQEFGVVRILQFCFGWMMRPFFKLPGVAILGALMAFLSDNPAVLTLAQDKNYSRYFKKYQLISFINFGTAFGMGLIVVVFMLGKGYAVEPLIGIIGATLGAMITTRLFQYLLLRDNPQFAEPVIPEDHPKPSVVNERHRTEIKKVNENVFIRFLNAILDGGKSGVDLGLAIIPGVIIISTAVFVLTFGTSNGVYDGSAFQGIELLPRLAGKINFVFDWMFGFKSAELIAFPITSLGAVGAALGQIPRFMEEGLLHGTDGSNAIAVFTAMGISWSGFLSTYSAIFDTLGYRALTSKAILVHFACGILAGMFAHWIYFVYALFCA